MRGQVVSHRSPVSGVGCVVSRKSAHTRNEKPTQQSCFAGPHPKPVRRGRSTRSFSCCLQDVCYVGDVSFAGDREGEVHCAGFVWPEDSSQAYIHLLAQYVQNYDNIDRRGYFGQ